MNSILTESVYKLYEQIQKFFYINQNNSSDTNKNIIDENTNDEEMEEIEEMEEKSCTTPSFHTEFQFEDKFGSEIYSMYYDECGDPFDSFNLANWDGDQQVGFRD